MMFHFPLLEEAIENGILISSIVCIKQYVFILFNLFYSFETVSVVLFLDNI